MVLTPKSNTDNSTITVVMSDITNNTRTRKYNCHFPEIFDVKQKNSVHRLGASKKSARKSGREIDCAIISKNGKVIKNKRIK